MNVDNSYDTAANSMYYSRIQHHKKCDEVCVADCIN